MPEPRVTAPAGGPTAGVPDSGGGVRHRGELLHAVSWLIRAAAFVLIGWDLFADLPHGPVALPAAVAGYALCGVLLAGWALLERPGPPGTADGPGAVERSGAAARPVPAAWLLAVLSAVACALSMDGGASSVAAIGVIATIDAGTQSRLATGWTVCGAGAAAVAVTAPFTGAGGQKAVVAVLALVVGLLTGFNRRAFRVRAEQSAALLDRTEELRSEQRRSAVLDERARIAREIHDILAHSLGALGIQIQAARALLADGQGTGRAQEVLAVAQRMASEGLAETRDAVHALRTGVLPLDEEVAALARTHEERHGVPVAVEVAGRPVPLPADKTVALTRTAREALVNAAKHAPGRPVRLALEFGGERVALTVSNALGARRDTGFATLDGGYGLTGVRERLLLLGGTLHAGPASAGPAPHDPPHEGPAPHDPAPRAAQGEWTLVAEVPR